MINIKKYVNDLIVLTILLPILHIECLGSRENPVICHSGGEESQIQDVNTILNTRNIGRAPVTPTNKTRCGKWVLAPKKKGRSLNRRLPTDTPVLNNDPEADCWRLSDHLQNDAPLLTIGRDGYIQSLNSYQQGENDNSLSNNNQQSND